MHGAQADGVHQEQPQHHWYTHCSLYICKMRMIRITVITIITVITVNNDKDAAAAAAAAATNYYSNAFQLMGS